MEPKITPKSVKICQNDGLETDSRKDSEKVPKSDSPDPQKQSFHIEGVAKINKSSALQTSTKMTPEWLPKWSPKLQKRAPRATPGGFQKKTEKKHANGPKITSKRPPQGPQNGAKIRPKLDVWSQNGPKMGG